MSAWSRIVARATPEELAELNEAMREIQAEERRRAAAFVRGVAPKYLDNEVDVAIFRALDAAAAAITNPDKENRAHPAQ